MFSVEQIKSLNSLELGIFQYIMQHQATIPYMRIRELAAETHVSTTTVLRFCKKIDCDGYAEFKYKFKQYLGQNKSIKIPDNIDELRLFLDRVENDTYQELLNKASDIIAKADRLLCVGTGSSGYTSQHAARVFTNFGKFSLSLTEPCYPVCNLGEKTDTVAVIFSVSGESYNTVALARILKKKGCSLICISNSDQNTIARLSDLTLPYFITLRRSLDVSDKSTEYVDFTSQVPAVTIAELLAKRVARRLDES